MICDQVGDNCKGIDVCMCHFFYICIESKKITSTNDGFMLRFFSLYLFLSDDSDEYG